MSDSDDLDDDDQVACSNAAQALSGPLTCRVFEGFCNRLNTLATALATGREVNLHWAVNEHCPARFEEMLRPLGRFSVVNEAVADYKYAVGPNELCWFYPRDLNRLSRDDFRKRLYAAYRQLHEHLRLDALVELPPRTFGFQFRRHFPGRGGLAHYMVAVERILQQLKPEHVYVASDCLDCKQAIVRHVQSRGVATSLIDCPLLAQDLDRSLENVSGMCRDLRALARCRLGVLTNSTRSTIPDSLRAFGVQAYYTFDDGFHRHRGRDELFEMLPVEALLAVEPRRPERATPPWQPFSVTVTPDS